MTNVYSELRVEQSEAAGAILGKAATKEAPSRKAKPSLVLVVIAPLVLIGFDFFVMGGPATPSAEFRAGLFGYTGGGLALLGAISGLFADFTPPASPVSRWRKLGSALRYLGATLGLYGIWLKLMSS